MAKLSIVVTTALVGAIAAFTGAFAQAVNFPTQKYLPLDLAIEAAEAAYAACIAMGPNNVPVVSVVDANGDEILYMVFDTGQTRIGPNNTVRKALTALNDGGQTSTEMMKRAMKAPGGVAGWLLENPSDYYSPGGAPIKVGDELIGAIGVTAHAAVDQQCADAGVAKIMDRLK